MYDIKDHLGNVRLVHDDSEQAKIYQGNYYSAFGVSILSLGDNMTPTQTVLSNDRLYNGKELQDGTNWLDYGARMYYPELGRWMAVDPLPDTGGQESWSTYQYVFNNPVRNTDPDGRFPTPHPSTVLWTSAGFSHNPNEAESYHLGKDLLQRAGKAMATVMAMVAPVEELAVEGLALIGLKVESTVLKDAAISLLKTEVKTEVKIGKYAANSAQAVPQKLSKV